MDNIFNITNYQGGNNSADSIISACNDANKYAKNTGKQAQVYIPTGQYNISQLTIQNINNVKVHFGINAKINMLPKGSWKWDGKSECINIENCANFIITGDNGSIVDGSGETWWNLGGDRPNLIGIDNCHDFEIYGLTIQNSPTHTCAISNSYNFKIHDMSILAPATSPNTDGIDIMGGVENAEIYNCSINNGDDGFAINSSRDKIVNNVYIHDCTITNGHGVSIGSAVYNDMKNVTFENLKIVGSQYGLRIKFGSGKSSPGKLENIIYKNISITDATRYAIYITAFYDDPPNSKASLKTISYNNITATHPNRAVYIQVVDEDQVKSPIVFNNVSITDIIDTKYKNKINAPIVLKGSNIGIKYKN